MKLITIIFAGFLTVISSALFGQSIDKTLQQETSALMATGLESNVGYQIVESLTTEVGQRLAGSEAEARARVWGVKKLEALGFQNVRIETFPVNYWKRHAEVAEITAPFPQ